MVFFTRFLNFIARKCLYLWIKTNVLNVDSVQGLQADQKLIIYVLENRAWSHLLVLEQECQRMGLPLPLTHIDDTAFRSWHRVYTVAHRLPFKAWMQKLPKRSRMLRGILDVIHENPQLDVYFVPVSIFWGRPVSKQKSWFRLMFADTWGLAGRTRKLLTILIHGRDTLVTFSEAISYQSLLNTHLSDDANIDHIQSVLSERLINLRAATLGPDVSHRRTLVRKILQTELVLESIRKRAEEDNLSEYRASLQARRYLYEIVANCTTITIRLLERGLTAFWNRFYSGIEINNCEPLYNLSLTHELVYVPCHRSHIDYLLLSYVIHSKGLVIPYIAAGKNLNMPVIGTVLRSAGAFFIRRSFKGNELYSNIMFEYIATILSMGMPVEYFIEGGRSRSGRILHPKPGILSMTVRAYLKYRQKPIAFVPVYIGYEKMIEGKAYIDEMSGKKKEKENLLGSLRAMMNIRGEYGQVYTNFGEPIYLDKLLQQAKPDWQQWQYTDQDRPDWLKSAVASAATKIVTEINRVPSLTATNLVATAIIATPTKHVDAVELSTQLNFYNRLLKALYSDGTVTFCALNGDEQIKRVESLGLLQRRTHPLGDILYANSRTTGLLNYYRNNTLHLFAMPSLVACCFRNRGSCSKAQIFKLIRLMYPIVRDEFFLCWNDEQIEDLISSILQAMVAERLLEINSNKQIYNRIHAGALEYTQLDQLANIVSPLLELYFLIFTLMLRNKDKRLTIDELVELCHLTAQRISIIYQISSPDYYDKKLITNFISSLVKMKYIETVNERLQFNTDNMGGHKDTRLLLSNQMRSFLLQILRDNHMD